MYRDLQNYAKWQLLSTWITYLNDDIVNDYYEFQLLNEFCIDILQWAMPYALGRVYAESVLPNNSKVTLIHMHIYVCHVSMYV